MPSLFIVWSLQGLVFWAGVSPELIIYLKRLWILYGDVLTAKNWYKGIKFFILSVKKKDFDSYSSPFLQSPIRFLKMQYRILLSTDDDIDIPYST